MLFNDQMAMHLSGSCFSVLSDFFFICTLSHCEAVLCRHRMIEIDVTGNEKTTL